MARIKIIIRYTGAGWQVTSSGKPQRRAPRPYATRDEAISDAIFAARLLEAMGDVTVLVESAQGMVEATTPPEQIWLRH